jgi:hypothetical protein
VLHAAAFAVATFAAYARDAVQRLERGWFAGAGWHECFLSGCRTRDSDWGADALTGVLALRYETARDASTVAPLHAILGNLPRYGAPCDRSARCTAWSDVPMWDAVAALAASRATGEHAEGVSLARRAFAFVDGSRVYALGACPDIDYQQPLGGRNRLKTLETDANYVRAALSLYAETRDESLLAKARAKYAAIRRYFLEPDGLYTVYVFDDGHTCRRLPGRTFASVNGVMMSNGLDLARLTGNDAYSADAVATARAVEKRLSDAAGIFTDLQAENDVVEPLVDAMLRVAREAREPFARAWILRNAAAARSVRTADGDYGRFFDGPPPTWPVTAWQTNGGFAIEIAAAALAPDDAPPLPARAPQKRARGFVVGATAHRLAFFGSGIMLFGTLGARCCESGHARVVVDGRETYDRTGIWQNKSSASLSLPGTLLFAWRWPKAGPHAIALLPGVPNPKEGGSFLRVDAVVTEGQRAAAR